MTQLTKQSLTDASVLAWAVDNSFVTENRKPVEFVKHRFFIDYLADDHPDKVSRKCAQVGATVLEALDDFHLAGKRGMNVIHTLHTSDVIKGLVTPKINPLIEYNSAIKSMVKGVDSESIKRLGDNYVYYRGCNAESQAISISADVLKIDELDRSNAQVAEMFLSRLDASDYKWLRRFSNPSAVGFGVDALYSDSNQLHWFVKCHHCNHDWFIDFEPTDQKNHYVDKQKEVYACGKCGGEISDEDRIRGRWVAKYPSRDHRHGYWFSQVMAPWITAKEIVSKWRGMSIDYLNNFVFGKAYTPSDLIIDRAAILRSTSPSNIVKSNCALGVDNGINKTWVLGNANGIFAHGITDSWDDIEKLILMYRPVVVIDPNPYPTTPKKLVDKYKGRVFICYFKESKDSKILQWGNKEKYGTVYADRTKSIDVVANEIVSSDILFRQTPYELEDYIEQWGNIYRATVEEDDGRSVSKWLKKEGKLNDYALATTYWRIALSKIIGSFGESRTVEPSLPSSKGTDTIVNGQLVTDLGQRIEESLEGDNGTDWRDL